LALHPPPDGGGKGVGAFGMVSSAASSDLPLPARQLIAGGYGEITWEEILGRR